MAGEWVQFDIGLAEKPEVQEIMALTGATVEQVVYRLFRLWGWATLNTEDGTLLGNAATLSRLIGGDQAFWEAVESVGWIKFPKGKSIVITSWEKRFSKKSKARMMDSRNKANRRMSGRHPDKSRTATGQKTDTTRTEDGHLSEFCPVGNRTDSPPPLFPSPLLPHTPSTPHLLNPTPPPTPSELFTSEPENLASEAEPCKRFSPPAVVDTTPVLYSVPVIGDPANPSWNLTRGLLNELSTFYPGHSVERSIRSAVAWIAANPGNRKTAKGMRRFLTSWIEREVNRPGGGGGGFKSAQEKRMDSISQAPAILDGLKETQSKQFDFKGTFGS